MALKWVKWNYALLLLFYDALRCFKYCTPTPPCYSWKLVSWKYIALNFLLKYTNLQFVLLACAAHCLQCTHVGPIHSSHKRHTCNDCIQSLGASCSWLGHIHRCALLVIVWFHANLLGSRVSEYSAFNDAWPSATWPFSVHLKGCQNRHCIPIQKTRPIGIVDLAEYIYILAYQSKIIEIFEPGTPEYKIRIAMGLGHYTGATIAQRHEEPLLLWYISCNVPKDAS